VGAGPAPEVDLSAKAPSEVSGVTVVALPFSVEEDGPTLGPGAAELLDRVDLDLLGCLEHHGATGRAGEVVEVPVLGSVEGRGSLGTVLLVGTGAGRSRDFRRAGAALARRTRGRETVATSIAALTDDEGLRAFVEGVVLGAYTFTLRSSPPTPPVRRVVLAGMARAASRRDALGRGLTAAHAARLSRTLAMVPANIKDPAWLAQQAVTTAEETGLEVRVWDEEELRAGGFGGLLGVGAASDNPPRLVQLSYTPERVTTETPHVVLVGKGITFDTGGLSIKPAEAMMNMKRDMTGAGVVLAVLASLAQVGCAVRVTGLLPCAENSVSGRALRPGDVLRHYGGRTSEVTNTDAEGRLVLADALAYAVAELAPAVLVDVATLTGAMKVALGQGTGGYFSTDDALAAHLRDASAAAGEPLWRMPLVDDYEERLESPIADADNAAGSPGALTAALFLRPFAGGLPWAHLDIASAGDSPVDAHEWTQGPTGFGARALLRWLEEPDPLAGVGARPVEPT